jgi:hypothetical protein
MTPEDIYEEESIFLMQPAQNRTSCWQAIAPQYHSSGCRINVRRTSRTTNQMQLFLLDVRVSTSSRLRLGNKDTSMKSKRNPDWDKHLEREKECEVRHTKNLPIKYLKMITTCGAFILINRQRLPSREETSGLAGINTLESSHAKVDEESDPNQKRRDCLASSVELRSLRWNPVQGKTVCRVAENTDWRLVSKVNDWTLQQDLITVLFALKSTCGDLKACWLRGWFKPWSFQLQETSRFYHVVVTYHFPGEVEKIPFLITPLCNVNKRKVNPK